MGIRQTLNENPAITAAATGGVILLALLFIMWSTCSGGASGEAMVGMDKAFFTTDDGKTWFVDDASNIPPYKVNKPGDPNHGKLAVRAVLYKCPGSEPFVSHLEKYSDADKQKLEQLIQEAKAAGAESVPMMYMAPGQAMMMLKKPRDKTWIQMGPQTMQRYTQIMRPVCPDGSTEHIERVNPE